MADDDAPSIHVRFCLKRDAFNFKWPAGGEPEYEINGKRMQPVLDDEDCLIGWEPLERQNG